MGQGIGEELLFVAIVLWIVGGLDALDLAARELARVLLPETDALADLPVPLAVVRRRAERCNSNMPAN